MNRCFASNWPCVSQMVPFADQLNHENVNVAYDCHDPATGKSFVSADEKKAREAADLANKKQERTNYLKELTSDLTNIADNMNVLYKDIDENNVWRIKTKGYLSKIQQDEIDERCDDIKNILAERQKKLERLKNAEEDLSSGLESDNDLDLLVE